MKQPAVMAFVTAGAVIGGSLLIDATTIRAQQPPTAAPSAPPTQAVPPIGPADPNLQIAPAPDGKKIHLLPATLETTQFGGIVKMALQLVDQSCCGHAEFCGLDTHEKSFGDIGNAAFENHTGNLWMSEHAMHGIQRPD